MLAILILVSQFDLLLSYRKCSIHSFSIVTKIKTKTEFFAVCNHNEPKREKVILYFNCMCVFLLLFQSFGRAHSLRTYKTAPKTHIDMRCEYAYSDKHDTRSARICIRGREMVKSRRGYYRCVSKWACYECVWYTFRSLCDMLIDVYVCASSVWLSVYSSHTRTFGPKTMAILRCMVSIRYIPVLIK